MEEETSSEVNQRIFREAEARIARYAHASEKEIRERLRELDREWDIERALETNASIAILATLALGKLADRRFYALSAAVAGFLFQHSVQGWCPPIPLLRRAGFRTAREIEHERGALLNYLAVS